MTGSPTRWGSVRRISVVTGIAAGTTLAAAWMFAGCGNASGTCPPNNSCDYACTTHSATVRIVFGGIGLALLGGGLWLRMRWRDPWGR
jgi:hypothetical protein